MLRSIFLVFMASFIYPSLCMAVDFATIPCGQLSADRIQILNTGSKMEPVICTKVKGSSSGVAYYQIPANLSSPLPADIINEPSGHIEYGKYVLADPADISANNFTWRYILQSSTLAPPSTGSGTAVSGNVYPLSQWVGKTARCYLPTKYRASLRIYLWHQYTDQNFKKHDFWTPTDLISIMGHTADWVDLSFTQLGNITTKFGMASPSGALQYPTLNSPLQQNSLEGVLLHAQMIDVYSIYSSFSWLEFQASLRPWGFEINILAYEHSYNMNYKASYFKGDSPLRCYWQ